MPFKAKKQPYITVMSVILAVVIAVYGVRIFSIQVLNREKYNSSVSGITVQTTEIKAPRGEILDRDGRKIAVNRDGYDIVFNFAYINRSAINELIVQLIKMCAASADEYVDNLPLSKTAPYGFSDENAQAKIVKFLGLADYATAEDCFARFVEKYKLEQYDAETQRQIMGVRYSMDKIEFSIAAPYTFAEDVSETLMLQISEASFILEGVTILVTPYREYSIGNLAPHLIGTVGPIYEEEWEAYKEKGYSYNDRVGKSGIEAYAEEHLRGINGEMTYKIDSAGNIISAEVTREPVAGKTVMLTLDKGLQLAAQNALKSTITEMQSKGSPVTGGAVVVMEVDSGAVLTSANYPSYDLNTVSKEYDKLTKPGSNSPLLDRAFRGIYPIGSTIKPLVAVASLENNKSDRNEVIKCVRTYTHFSDFTPSCMHYHGNINLKNAISRSCNYYFFELGRRIGINTLTQYFKDFGLGVATGVEVNDSAGLLMEYEYDSGNTIQVAIGQLNAFTPLQLSVYTSTLANGGTHYKATLIDKITSQNQRETYFSGKAEILNTVNISETTADAVKAGMLSVTVDGTGSTVFGNYPIKIGGKTGTSQTDSGADHSVFVAYAPFDNPEIVISVVLEHGSSTFSTTSVAKAVFDQYFFGSDTEKQEILPYTVLE